MFARLAEAVEDLVTLDLSGCTDDELTEAVVTGHRLVEQVRGVLALVVDECNVRKLHDAEDFKSAPAWVADRCRLKKSHAAAECRHGRLLRQMDKARAALWAGQISLEHIRVLGKCTGSRTREAFTRDEGLLVDQAVEMPFADFEQVVAYWVQVNDPDGSDAAAEERKAKRRCSLSESFDGELYGDFRLDPIGGAIFKGVFEDIERELFLADWAEARERLGRKPMVSELGRTPAQRRADAIVEMARRAGAVIDGARL